MGVRFLRHVGMVLIVLPDPVTTILGVVLVFASRYLSRKLEERIYKHLRIAIKQYLSHVKRSHVNNTDSKFIETASGGYYIRHEDLVPRRYEGNRGYIVSSARPGENSWRDTHRCLVSDNRKTQALLSVHTNENSAWNGHRTIQTPDAEKVIYDYFNMELLCRRYKRAIVEPAKPIHHAIDIESLQRRYGLVESRDIEGENRFRSVRQLTPECRQMRVDR